MNVCSTFGGSKVGSWQTVYGNCSRIILRRSWCTRYTFTYMSCTVSLDKNARLRCYWKTALQKEHVSAIPDNKITCYLILKVLSIFSCFNTVFPQSITDRETDNIVSQYELWKNDLLFFMRTSLQSYANTHRCNLSAWLKSLDCILKKRFLLSPRQTQGMCWEVLFLISLAFYSFVIFVFLLRFVCLKSVAAVSREDSALCV